MSDGQPACSVRAEVREMVDREIGHLRELIERTTAEKEVALSLQRDEYHRRLNELNHAHAKAELAYRATVPRETFDVFVGAYNRWREEVMAETISIKSSAATRDRIFYVVMSLGGLIISGIAVWLAFKSK